MPPPVPADAVSLEGYLGLALVVLVGVGLASTGWTLVRGALRLAWWAASGAALSVVVTLLLRH